MCLGCHSDMLRRNSLLLQVGDLKGFPFHHLTDGDLKCFAARFFQLTPRNLDVYMLDTQGVPRLVTSEMTVGESDFLDASVPTIHSILPKEDEVIAFSVSGLFCAFYSACALVCAL